MHAGLPRKDSLDSRSLLLHLNSKEGIGDKWHLDPVLSLVA